MKILGDVDLISIFVDEMEAQGVNRKLIHNAIDEAFLERLNIKFGTAASLEQIRKLVDRCLANEWLEHGSIDAKYSYLQLTATGLGVVRSKQRSDEAKQARSGLKILSDVIEDHKGLFVALGALIALVALILKPFSK